MVFLYEFRAAVAQISTHLKAHSESTAHPQISVLLQAVVAALESASSKLTEATPADSDIASIARVLYGFAEIIHEQHEDSLVTSFLPIYFEDLTHVLEQIRSVIGASNAGQEQSLSQMAAELIVMERELNPQREAIPVESNTDDEHLTHDWSELDFRDLGSDELRSQRDPSSVKFLVDPFPTCKTSGSGAHSSPGIESHFPYGLVACSAPPHQCSGQMHQYSGQTHQCCGQKRRP
ncbi:hypothetical protein C8J57DRAFT_1378142 [Mycena rebaudengoi]|nr:hypothetical protein C8J57DRAFT_1378142 [Mycena rebaudengoi]